MQGKLFKGGWQNLLQCIVHSLQNIQKLWNLIPTLLSRLNDKTTLKHTFTARFRRTSFGMSEGKIYNISNTTSVTHCQWNLTGGKEEKKIQCHIHHTWKECNWYWMTSRIGDTTHTLTEVTRINQLRKPSYSKQCLPQISMNIQMHTIYILDSYSWIIHSIWLTWAKEISHSNTRTCITFLLTWSNTVHKRRKITWQLIS